MRVPSVMMNAALLGSACASAQHTETLRRVHVETSFDLVVHAPASDAMKLFTPEGERAWSGEHWDPQYVFPVGPTRDSVGAVFTIQHGPVRTIWTVVRRDDVAGEYGYVYFIPDLMLTTISVRFQRVSAETTNVHVLYARTALSPPGESHVVAMSERDKDAGTEWQSALNRYLAGKAAPPE